MLMVKIMVTIILASFLVATLACIIGEIFDKYKLENFGNFMFKVTGTEVLVGIITFLLLYSIISIWS